LPGVLAHAGSPTQGHRDTDTLHIPLDGSMALDDMDCYIIRTVLDRYEGNVTGAARALGTTRETLRYRIRKYGLGDTV
jgi:DNA-binding protein Fis